jgi:hypothetical protein
MTTFRKTTQLALGMCAAALAMQGGVAAQGVNVWTYHNDNQRSGVNPVETVLTPDVVRTNFGKLWSYPVDGNVYAQPLYLTNQTVNGSRHDVVFVATQHNSVYAFDANTCQPPLWHKCFVNEPAVTSVPSPPFRRGPNPLQSYDIVPEVGITGTPVIDVPAGTIYFVTKTIEATATGPRCVQRLHALDVTSGAERANSPVEIMASVPGTGNGLPSPADAGKKGDNDGNNHVRFDPLRQNQRAGLLLTGGVVYVTWGSHGDIPPYHGWLLGYNAGTLEQVAALNTTPDGAQGAIWQAGVAPAADDGNIFLATGNGSFDKDKVDVATKRNYGECVLKISTTNQQLRVVDYFSPANRDDLDERDMDLGSGGVMLLPDQPGAQPRRLVIAGKDGTIFVLNRDDLGKFTPAGDRVLQKLPGALSLRYGGGAFFNGNLYIGGGQRIQNGKDVGDALKRFTFAGGQLSATPAAVAARPFRSKSTTPSVSANGTSGAVVWAIRAEAVRQPPGVAVLHAYDAATLATLYESDANVTDLQSDHPGMAVKFAVPTIAGGKVFVGSRGEISVYGKLGS